MSNKAKLFVHRIKISPPFQKREAGIRRGYAVPSNLVFLFGGTYIGLVHITENYPFTIIEPLCHFQYELNLIKYMWR